MDQVIRRPWTTVSKSIISDFKMQLVIGSVTGNQLTDNRVTSSEDTA